MVFAIVKPITGDKMNLCKINERQFLDVGDFVVFVSNGVERIGRMMGPDFDGDVAAVLDAWGIQLKDVKQITAVMRRVSLIENDDCGDDGNLALTDAPCVE